MVLSDFSPAVRPSPGASWKRSPALAVLSSLALCTLVAMVMWQNSGKVSLLELGGLDEHADEVHGKIQKAAHNAENFLKSDIQQLRGRNHPSIQSKALADAMGSALKAVTELEGQRKSDAVRKARAEKAVLRRKRGTQSLRAKEAAEHVEQSLSKVRIAKQHQQFDKDIAEKEMKLTQNAAVRNELRKLVETAQRLRGEMQKVSPSKKAYGTRAVLRRADAVVRAGIKVQQDSRRENKARKQVIQHELQVQREKLAEAEEEEKAASRATAEARAAERLAVRKHKEAAADEARAVQRRRAATRAEKIAEDGAKGTVNKKEVAAREETSQPAVTARQCTDIIASVGCRGIDKDSDCRAFCVDAEDAALIHSGKAVLGVEEHHRTGFFAQDRGHDSYVDSVYGGVGKLKDVLATYDHRRHSFFQDANGYGDRGQDLASSGHDLQSVGETQSVGSTGALLAREQTMDNSLEKALSQTQAENQELKARMASQTKDLQSLSKSLSFLSARPDQSPEVLGSTPPLPKYAATGTQDLAQVPASMTEGARGEGADGLVIDNDAFKTANVNRASHDPYRPF